jgi:hypothetical protein
MAASIYRLVLLVVLATGVRASAEEPVVSAPANPTPPAATPPTHVGGAELLPTLTNPIDSLPTSPPTNSLISMELSRLDAVVSGCAEGNCSPRVWALFELEILEQRMSDRMETLFEMLKARPDMPQSDYESMLAKADVEARLESEMAGRKPVPGDPAMAMLRRSESERILAEFQGRLALAALGTRPELARQYERLANDSLDRASRAVRSVDPALRASETPRLLTRLAETKLSLDQFHFLSISDESTTEAIREMNKTIDRFRAEHRPLPVEKAQLDVLEAEAFLSMAERAPGQARATIYVQPELQDRYRDLIAGFDAERRSVAAMPEDTPGRQRLNDQLHILSIAAPYFGGGTAGQETGFAHLNAAINSEDPAERDMGERAADYLMDTQSGTFAGYQILEAAKGWGERPNFSRRKHAKIAQDTAKSYDEELRQMLGDSLHMKLQLPTYRELVAAEGHLAFEYNDFLDGLATVAEKQRKNLEVKGSFSDEEIAWDLQKLDLSWIRMQCVRLSNHHKQIVPEEFLRKKIKTPFKTFKADLRPCGEANSIFEASTSTANQIAQKAISHRLNVDLSWIAGDFAVTVATAIGSGGLSILAKQGLKTAYKKVGFQLLRKAGLKALTVKSTARGVALGAGQVLLIETTNGTVAGVRNYVQSGFNGEWDLENMKLGMPWLNPSINNKEHVTRLFATSVANFGLGKVWTRALSNKASKSFAASPALNFGLESVKSTINGVFSGAVDRAVRVPFNADQSLLQAATPVLDYNHWIATFQGSLRGRMVDMAATRTRGIGERYIGASFIERMGEVRLGANDINRLSSIGTCVTNTVNPASPAPTPAPPRPGN